MPVTPERRPAEKPKQSAQSLQQPLPHIVDEFRLYIRNHIPTRLINTVTHKFVERDSVYDVFASDIARITEQDVQKRMRAVSVDTHPKVGSYVNPGQEALQETIRDVLRYAIFSHHRTDGDLTYQDVSSSAFHDKLDGRRSVGTTKFINLCQIAHTLGYKLVWSDTCCIDKTKKAERRKAVHAMFEWYARAHVCIVHLAASSSLANFEREPWFKSGWALQGLLAPRRIKFYDKDWRPFTAINNDKDNQARVFMDAVSNVTGIPRNVIVADNSHGIRGHSVWEIMSWAAPRNTKDIEDAAYCLLGLFDISLSIEYGEGEKAFPRLVEAIVAQHPTWDIFAWAGQASERHPALPSSPACYMGWDVGMAHRRIGMTAFTLTPQELRLTSVPPIPVIFESVAETKGPSVVTLRPRSSTKTALGMYGDVTVVCGSKQLQQIRNTDDLHVCILNYEPWSRQGTLQVGRTYICLLLKKGDKESSWLKFVTDNVLRITCRGIPEEASPEVKGGRFDLPLKKMCIRAP